MSRERRKLEYPGVMDYLRGAWVANGPSLLLFFILSFIEPQALFTSRDVLLAISLLFIFVGAVVAGYVVARGVVTNHVIVGGLTGGFSFLMHSFMFTLLLSIEKGLNVWLIPVFVLGGCIGGLLRKRRLSK